VGDRKGKKIIDFSVYSTKIDQMYSEVALNVSSKNLYLRRSQNNAYNHDGLVDSDAVSRKTFFSSPFSMSHFLSGFPFPVLFLHLILLRFVYL